MNKQQIDKLNRIKELIKQGKCYFAERKDRDYALELRRLCISEAEAWRHIMGLNCNYFFIDPRMDIRKNNDALIFKKMINKKIVYIKITINKNEEEEAVCISFHEDRR